MRIALVGLGAVGTRVARQLLSDPEVTSLVLMCREPERVADIVGRFLPPDADRIEIRPGMTRQVPVDSDVVVLTQPEGVREAAELALSRGAHVVSTCDGPEEVARLLALDRQARSLDRTVAVGAAMAPGMTCVLAAYGAKLLDEVSQVRVFSLGTGGPACARRHHAAMSSLAVDYIDGDWRRRPAGSGRELVWFPGPAGATDCYRAGLADPLLLAPAFPAVQRVTSRLASTRRDRATAWLPMLRRPHPEGRLGAVRVELRGRRQGVAEVLILGATSRPAVIAGAVASLAATHAGSGRLARHGAGGLGELVAEPGLFLRTLHSRGVRTVQFAGSESEVQPFESDPSAL